MGPALSALFVDLLCLTLYFLSDEVLCKELFVFMDEGSLEFKLCFFRLNAGNGVDIHLELGTTEVTFGLGVQESEGLAGTQLFVFGLLGSVA